jgi:hypothetical protein
MSSRNLDYPIKTYRSGRTARRSRLSPTVRSEPRQPFCYVVFPRYTAHLIHQYEAGTAVPEKLVVKCFPPLETVKSAHSARSALATGEPQMPNLTASKEETETAPPLLGLAPIQGIECKKDQAGLAPECCFISVQAIEREIRQIG